MVDYFKYLFEKYCLIVLESSAIALSIGFGATLITVFLICLILFVMSIEM